MKAIIRRTLAIIPLVIATAVVAGDVGRASAAICPANYTESVVWKSVSQKPVLGSVSFSATVPANSIGSLTDTRVRVIPVTTPGNYTITSDVGAGLAGTRYQSKVSYGNTTTFNYGNGYSSGGAPRTLTITIGIQSNLSLIPSWGTAVTDHKYTRCTAMYSPMWPQTIDYSMGNTYFR